MPQNASVLEDDSAAGVDGATELFTRYSTRIYRYCLRRLGSPEEAEDALQLTFLNAWRSLKSGFEPDRQGPWLFGIAANVCSTSLRANLGSTRLELRDPETLDELAADEKAGREELLGLSEALRQLPVRQRRAVLLRDWQGLSYREIAAELAVSVASVETLLFRGRKRVAATLASADWRKAAPSVRSLLIWPFAFLRTKSLPIGGGEHLKLGLTLAGGTVAPLVAFGVIQGFLPGEAKAVQPARTPSAAAVKAADASGSWLDDGNLPHAVLANHAKHDQDAGRARSDRKPNSATKKTAKPTGADSSESSAAASAPPKVVICHSTSSKTNPGVTLTVSAYALKGLSHDPAGQCG
jgi:RNA polymerase sigma factor (sigma-70 family)